MRIEILASADADIDGIWIYTAETWSQNQADAYVGKIYQAISTLDLNLSQIRDWQGRHYTWKRLKVERHYVFMVQLEATLSVVRILHQSMDFIKHLET